MVLYLSVAGVMQKFWFFTFVYASQVRHAGPSIPSCRRLYIGFSDVTEGFFLVWVFAALGFVSLFLNPDFKEKAPAGIALRRVLVPDGLPRFLFQTPLLRHPPAGCFLTGRYFCRLPPHGLGARVLKSSPSTPVLPTCIAIAVFAPALIIGIVRQSDYLFEEDPFYLSRNIYAFNPFPESIDIARFIKDKYGG